MSQKFRADYNQALSQFPLITSSKYITRVEVWITNRNSTTEDVRNIVALADLGEAEPTNFGPPFLVTSNGGPGPRNEANNLNLQLTSSSGIRNISDVNNTIGQSTSSIYKLQQGSGYSILENARKLTLGIDLN